MRTNFKDLLVMYKGGGYDGCYWEWNFFLFDAEGTFHQIKSSGRKGVKSKEEAIKMIKEDSFGYTFKLTNKKAIKEFSNETNNHLIDIVGTKVNCIYKKEVIKWECDECGDSIACESDPERQERDPYPTMFHDDHEYHWETKLCEACYLNHSCGYCGEFNEEHENNKDDAGHCVYCIPKEQKAGA